MAPIPAGLSRCAGCGELRGRLETEPSPVVISCLCDGIPCPRCRVGRIHRPISDYYDEHDGAVVHVPYFAWRFSCRNCRDAKLD